MAPIFTGLPADVGVGVDLAIAVGVIVGTTVAVVVGVRLGSDVGVEVSFPPPPPQAGTSKINKPNKSSQYFFNVVPSAFLQVLHTRRVAPFQQESI